MKQILIPPLRSYTLLLLASLALLISSCQSGGFVSIKAAGSPGEILLVMQQSWLEGEIGQEVIATLRSEVPALPQTEPWLRVQTVSHDNYGQFLRNTRNILYIDNNEEIYTTVSVKYSYDPHAKGQLVVTLQTPTKELLHSYLQEQGRTLCDLFLRHELFRLAENVVESASRPANNYSQEIFGYRINVPTDVQSYKKGENFLWLSNNATRKRYDFVLFRIPYTSSQLPSALELIALRDSVLGKEIPGSHPESHMATSDYGGEYRLAELPNGKKYAELRGLWEMTAPDIMAGPFVAHAFIQESEGMLYYVEGFVYHPNENKRDLIRMLQASLFSFRPESEESFDPEPIKRLRWGAVTQLTVSSPTFATQASSSTSH